MPLPVRHSLETDKLILRMNILHTVQTYPPSEGGMAEVVKQLSERLAAKGHAVTVVAGCHPERADDCVINGVHVKSFAVNGNQANGLEGDYAGYEHFLLESRFDVVVNFAAQQWATDIALPLLPRIRGRKVFVPTGFSGLYSGCYQDYFRQLPEFMRQYDMNVFHSDCYRDIDFARSQGISKTVLIPNGAAADEFKAPFADIRSHLDIPDHHFLILHVGSHTGLKGHKEAMEIFSHADIREATLLLVGNEPPGGCASHCLELSKQINSSSRIKADGRRVIVTSLSRSDTVSAYHAADLFLFPSKIECSPIVLFECMASRTPFLVTNVGNSAEIIGWSGGAGALLPSGPTFLRRCAGSLLHIAEKMGITADRTEVFPVTHANIKASVALLEALYIDTARREKMAESGFQAWQGRFTWERIAGEYEALYRSFVEGSG